jgi:hypothetical protein
MSRCLVLAGLVLLWPTWSGCGRSDNRQAFSGTVTLDGKPLDQGTVEFVPVAKGLLSGGVIASGKFDVPADKGLTPGTYTVRVYSADAPSGDASNADAGAPGAGGYPMAKDRIPPKYNSESTQTAEITARGKNRFSFEVMSK